MLLNKCSKCGVISWEKTTCDRCENEIRKYNLENNIKSVRRLDPVLEEYMKAHDNSICGKKTTIIAKTPYAIYVCGQCEYKGILGVVNGKVVIQKYNT